MNVGVAIVDEGIDFLHPALTGCKYTDEVVISEEGVVLVDKMPSHGTNIASVIHQASKAIFFVSIRLVAKGRINAMLLCRALEYCATRTDIRIINISLGFLSSNPPVLVEKACRQCVESGMILVAAAHYERKKYCYPAAFPTVYGVGTGIAKNINDFQYLGDGYINILAKGIHQRLLSDEGKPTIRPGTSYAAAAFTGIVANILAANGNLQREQLREILKEKSTFLPTTHYPWELEEATIPRRLTW